MHIKTIAIVLALQLTYAFAAPQAASNMNGSTKTVKVTTTTTTTTIQDDQQLQRILRDPTLYKELQEFLYHFLALFRILNKGSKTQVVTTAENIDVYSVLQDESIRNLLFNTYKFPGAEAGLGSLLTHILDEEEAAKAGTTTRPTSTINLSLFDRLKEEVTSGNTKVTINEVHKSTEEELKQARNARYSFTTQVQDNIMGNYLQRVEFRENGVVYGKYSYDDGFNFRTTYYMADVNGYRVTKQDVLPSRIKALTGDAQVQTYLNGKNMDYHITEKDISTAARGGKWTNNKTAE